MNTLSIEFWEAKLPSFGGFMYSGSSGWLAYILFRIMFPIMGFGWMRKAILEGVWLLLVQNMCCDCCGPCRRDGR